MTVRCNYTGFWNQSQAKACHFRSENRTKEIAFVNGITILRTVTQK